MRIFVLEDDPDRIRWFAERFLNHDWTCIQTCEREYEFQPPYDLILLDHDLGGRQMVDHEDSGMTFVNMIKDRVGNTPVIVHSFNGYAALQMVRTLQECNCEAVYAPFRGGMFNQILDQLLSAPSGFKGVDHMSEL